MTTNNFCRTMNSASKLHFSGSKSVSMESENNFFLISAIYFDDRYRDISAFPYCRGGSCCCMKTRHQIWIEALVQCRFLPVHIPSKNMSPSLYSTYEYQIQQRKLCKTDITIGNVKVELIEKQGRLFLKLKKLFV